jgi:hypothetical protein
MIRSNAIICRIEHDCLRTAIAARGESDVYGTEG